jgi:hypothetical protein
MLRGLKHYRNPTTDAMRERYHAAVAARPPLSELQRRQARLLLEVAAENLREAYKVLQGRPDLSDGVSSAGRAVMGLRARVDLETPHDTH